MKIPKCMSTQHPDNVNPPFFARDTELGGEDEVQEAYYAFSNLGCDEQMWDYEGKEVDAFVVKKLLNKYESFFKQQRLGKDIFLTLRVPNPTVERTEAKVLLETLESIPRSYDVAKLFYGDDIPPIFEVILPMTASYKCVDRIYQYYREFVVGKQTRPFRNGDLTIAEWIGEFKPARINVIPLFEDMAHMLAAADIVGDYLRGKEMKYQRVFLARSDPAMNYGMISAVLLNKIALQRLYKFSNSSGVRIYPIVGVGSAPFRGNLRPSTVDRVSAEYPSAHTFTVQSAFKYDNPPNVVEQAVKRLSTRESGAPHEVDEGRALEIIDKYCREYKRQIIGLAPVINRIARHIPSRRKRKLHIGLFGYARNIEGVSLPRAIGFTASLYSIGLPPEILGLNALDDDDLKYIRTAYTNFDIDLKDALQYLDVNCNLVPKSLLKRIDTMGISFKPDSSHVTVTSRIVSLLQENRTEDLPEHILQAANIRRFLG